MDREIVIDEVSDSDTEKLLAILRRIPEVEIPGGFEQRLNEALKIEGNHIRQKRINRYGKMPKWSIKAAVAAAACFIVVFASISVYNDGKGSLSNLDTSEIANNGEITSGLLGSPAEEAADMQSDDAESAKGYEGLRGLGYSEDKNDTGTYPDGAQHRETLYGAETTEQDILCREGSKYIEADKEYLNYKRLIEESLSCFVFELIACEREGASGRYLFTIRILHDQEGQSIDKTLILAGEQGEIYEYREDEHSANEEPQISSD